VIKIVEDNYPLQSGHKFTTNNEVSVSFWRKMQGYEGECGKMAAILTLTTLN
jgi:hypothetical protein